MRPSAAKTDLAGGSKGISMFIVEKGMKGFSVGRKLDKMGWRCSDTAELVFDDCRVPAAKLLRDEGRGFYSVMKNFQNERIAIGAPLWDKQAIRQRLSMLAAKVEAGRQLVRHAASLDAEGCDCVKEVSMLKAYCGELVKL